MADTDGNALMAHPVPNQAYPQSSYTLVSFTFDETNVLNTHIHVFQLILRGLPIPSQIQQAIRVLNEAIPTLRTLL